MKKEEVKISTGKPPEEKGKAIIKCEVCATIFHRVDNALVVNAVIYPVCSIACLKKLVEVH